VRRARICVWAVAVGTANKRKRKRRDVFFIVTLNSLKVLLASGNDAEVLTRRATALSRWINDERRLVSGKLREFPARPAGTRNYYEVTERGSSSPAIWIPSLPLLRTV
jgi:hypothetical protein